jgi:hypothetical protein
MTSRYHLGFEIGGMFTAIILLDGNGTKSVGTSA